MCHVMRDLSKEARQRLAESLSRWVNSQWSYKSSVRGLKVRIQSPPSAGQQRHTESQGREINTQPGVGRKEAGLE